MSIKKSAENMKVNVKDFGAKGDGKTDDFRAIQNALDACIESGGTIYVPDGTYLITECLIIYSHQTLEMSKNATIKRGSRVRYLLAVHTKLWCFGYHGTHDVCVRGGSFDGNHDIDEKLTIVNTCHAKNILIDGVSFVNGCYWHYIEINSTKNAVIKNCNFDGSSYVRIHPKGLSELVQIDTSVVGLYGPVYKDGKVMRFMTDFTPCRDVTVESNTFICSATPALGNHSNYPHSNIKFVGNTVEGSVYPEAGHRGFAVFTKKVKGVEICHSTFTSNAPANALNAGITVPNKKIGAGFVHHNTFSGRVEPRFRGGIVEEHNTFK